MLNEFKYHTNINKSLYNAFLFPVGWLCGHTRLGNKMSMLVPAISATVNFEAMLTLIEVEKDCVWNRWLQELFVYFQIEAPVIPQSMTKDWENFGESHFTQYIPIKTKPKGNFTVSGYRQNWRYAQSFAEMHAVNEMFKFTTKYQQHADKTIADARRQFNVDPEEKATTVGVHMRIGDLREIDRITFGYQMANTEFYSNALSNATKALDTKSNIIFIVGTDSPKEALKLLSNVTAIYNFYFLHGTDFEDFATLASCDHMITSGGTYGWWAAWLTKGLVFYHAQFAKPGTGFAKDFNNEYFFPPHWVAVNSSYPHEAREEEMGSTDDNPIPEVYLPCDHCLQGKQLVTVQLGKKLSLYSLTTTLSS